MDISRRVFMGSSAAGLLAAAQLSAQAPVEAAKKRYRACVIADTEHGGYGHSLHLVWGNFDNVEVAGLADPHPAGREKGAAEAKAQRSYADYVEMLEKEKPDLVAIAPRWTAKHREYLLAAAACGAHGIMEKPIASDLTDADAMIQAIEAKNLRWTIAFNFRVLPIIQHVKKLVMEEGLIGEVLELRGRGKEDQRAGGEDLLVLGTHIFDLMRFLAGDAQWCQSDITVEGRPATLDDVREASEPIGPVLGDRIRAMYGFGNGVAGYFASTKSAEGNGGRWGLDICGSKGMVTIRQNGSARVWLLRDSSWTGGGSKAVWEPLPDAPGDGMTDPARQRYAPIVADLMAAIEEERTPKVSLQDGRSSLEMIQAVYAAYVKGGRVRLPLEDRACPLRR